MLDNYDVLEEKLGGEGASKKAAHLMLEKYKEKNRQGQLFFCRLVSGFFVPLCSLFDSFQGVSFSTELFFIALECYEKYFQLPTCVFAVALHIRASDPILFLNFYETFSRCCFDYSLFCAVSMVFKKSRTLCFFSSRDVFYVRIAKSERTF